MRHQQGGLWMAVLSVGEEGEGQTHSDSGGEGRGGK